MTVREVADLMAAMKGRVTARTRRTVNLIIALAMQYSDLGTDFTFDADDELDHQVNLLLVQLSDAIAEDSARRAAQTVDDDEDRETALAWARRPIDGRDATERMDQHCSDLKLALEGFLAVCFAKNYQQARILTEAGSFLNSPNTWPPMRDAFGDTRYRAPFIGEGGFHFGPGMPTDARKGMTLVSQGIINSTFQRGVILGYQRDPSIVAYKVHRGSDYDCPLCDDLCVGVHFLDEQVLPAHPRCMCYTTPVRAADLV